MSKKPNPVIEKFIEDMRKSGMLLHLKRIGTKYQVGVFSENAGEVLSRTSIRNLQSVEIRGRTFTFPNQDSVDPEKEINTKE